MCKVCLHNQTECIHHEEILSWCKRSVLGHQQDDHDFVQIWSTNSALTLYKLCLCKATMATLTTRLTLEHTEFGLGVRSHVCLVNVIQAC